MRGFIRGILLTAPLLSEVSRPSLVLGPAHSDAPAAPVVVEMSLSFLPPEKRQNAPIHVAAEKVAGELKDEREGMRECDSVCVFSDVKYLYLA